MRDRVAFVRLYTYLLLIPVRDEQEIGEMVQGESLLDFQLPILN